MADKQKKKVGIKNQPLKKGGNPKTKKPPAKKEKAPEKGEPVWKRLLVGQGKAK